MRTIAVILYGPPGSGKGVQANLLAEKVGLIHFDTGRFLETLLYDPERRREPAIQRERRNFEGGKLVSPLFTAGEVGKHVARLARAGWGVVLSGSPRAVPEAEKLFPLLNKLYGRRNIFLFILNVPPSVSMRRNSSRFVCSFCGAPLLTAFYPTKRPRYCPVCGGRLYRRTLDKPATIKIRLAEYANRTEPVFAFARRRGYTLHRIDGRAAPYKVFQKISGILKRRFKWPS